MSKWEMVRLGDVCEFINGDRGKNYPSGKDFVEIGVPFVNAGHLVDNAVSLTNMNYITEHKYQQLGSGKIEKGDFLYCLRGSLGKHAIVNNLEQGAVASSLVILRPFNINLHYLSYCLDSSKIAEQQLKVNTGSSQPNLSASSVKKYLIPLPPLAIQEQIASTLDTAAALLALRKQKLAELAALIQSVFIEMFGDPLLNPKGWKSVQLADIAEIVSGITKGRKIKEQELLEVPYMRVGNVKDGHIDLTEIKTIEATQSEIERYTLKFDDVLMTEGGDPDKLGRGAIWREKIENCIHQNHIFRVRVEQERMLPQYFAEYLRHHKAKRYFLGCAKQTTGIASINMSQLKLLPVLLPPLTLQAKFAAIVEKIEQQKALVQQAIDETQTLFDSLMSRYFQ